MVIPQVPCFPLPFIPSHAGRGDQFSDELLTLRLVPIREALGCDRERQHVLQSERN